MKEFIDRLNNFSGNVRSGKIDRNNEAADQINGIVDDMEAYKPPTDITDQEYDDMQTLAKIAERHAKKGDGLDHDFIKGIQDAQRILLLRVGSRHWSAKHKQKTI